jgi:hypothetical protein
MEYLIELTSIISDSIFFVLLYKLIVSYTFTCFLVIDKLIPLFLKY